MRTALVLSVLLPLLAGCSSDPVATAPTKTDDQYRDEAVAGMHAALLKDIGALVQAASALQSAAPTPADRGWDASADHAAFGAMKAAWIDARAAYERVEGALAPLFPSIDSAIDARYDDFMTNLAPQGGDPYLFDGQG